MARWIALAAGLLGALVVGLTLILPFLREGRVLPAAIPQPSPLFGTALVSLEPGTEACMRNVVIDDRSEVAVLKVGTRRKPGQPLSFRIVAGDYVVERRHPPSYQDNDVVTFTAKPPGTPRRAEICVGNEGRAPVDLYAADDRTRTRGETYVDGKRVFPNFMIFFTERFEIGFGRRFETIAHRLATFRPGGAWIPWALVIALLAGVPLALAVALFRSAADDEDAA